MRPCLIGTLSNFTLFPQGPKKFHFLVKSLECIIPFSICESTTVFESARSFLAHEFLRLYFATVPLQSGQVNYDRRCCCCKCGRKMVKRESVCVKIERVYLGIKISTVTHSKALSCAGILLTNGVHLGGAVLCSQSNWQS